MNLAAGEFLESVSEDLCGLVGGCALLKGIASFQVYSGAELEAVLSAASEVAVLLSAAGAEVLPQAQSARTITTASSREIAFFMLFSFSFFLFYLFESCVL